MSFVLTWIRFLHVHFKAVAVTRLPWIRFLHVLCSVSAAADPPFLLLLLLLLFVVITCRESYVHLTATSYFRNSLVPLQRGYAIAFVPGFQTRGVDFVYQCSLVNQVR